MSLIGHQCSFHMSSSGLETVLLLHSFDLITLKDEKFRPVFYHAFRNTLVTESLDQASYLAYSNKRYRVVTLKGELIESSGAMSGGGRPKSGLIKTNNSFNDDV